MSINKNILVVDDEIGVRRLLQEIITKAGYKVITAENGQEAIEKVRSAKPSIVIMDIKMPVMDGMEAFEVIKEEYPNVAVILLTAFSTTDLAVSAMKKGAFDYLCKPSNVVEVRDVVDKAYKMQCLKKSSNKEELVAPPEKIFSHSPVMHDIYKTIGKIAETNVTVLITGESGSGKEVVAKTIHAHSLRNNGPFIKVNCGALPEGLMESELFGYEKGAFTGAVGRKPGRFELANGGTLFLDEIGELPLHLQVKILRALQEREFERVGGIETIKVDVRIIAATNRNLEELVQTGDFRQDLYYRLKVVPIHVPPLRERKEDLPLLIEYFINHFSEIGRRSAPVLTPEAMDFLMKYKWPGNVRELANVIERAVIMTSGVMAVQDFPGLVNSSQEHNKLIDIDYHEGTALKDTLRKVEKKIISQALQLHNGNRVRTAQALSISRRALLYKIEEYDINDIK